MKSSLFRFFLGGGEGEKGGGSGEEEEREPTAVHLPCDTSHSNASKLDAVFVDQCFVQCLLA